MFRRILLGALFIGVLVAGWMFADGNGAAVDIDYVFGDVKDVTLWKALIGSAALGAASTATVLGWWLARARLEARRFRRALVDLESEVHQLRNLPAVGREALESPEDPVTARGGTSRGD